jgi:hypothetical protein
MDDPTRNPYEFLSHIHSDIIILKISTLYSKLQNLSDCQEDLTGIEGMYRIQ